MTSEVPIERVEENRLDVEFAASGACESAEDRAVLDCRKGSQRVFVVVEVVKGEGKDARKDGIGEGC